MKPFFWILLLTALGACKTPSPRRPAEQPKLQSESSSVQLNKKLLQEESTLIKQYVERHSNQIFKTSPSGLWYAAPTIQDSPYKKGTKIHFQYEVYDLNDKNIYKREQIGNQTYYVDEQPIMFGLKEALSILPEGASGKFLLPSILAYGVLGDRNKIEPNTPLVIHLKITTIERTNK